MDPSLLFLRLAIGGMALLSGFEGLRQADIPATMIQTVHWGLLLAEMLCGALVMIGLLMPVASWLLVLLVGWPLADAWLHGAPLLAHRQDLFVLLVTLACALGGAGRWSVGRS